MNNNDAIKGSELYLKNHGFDLGKLSQCSSADEIDAIINSTVSKKNAPLFKAIINKSFIPNDDGSFKPFYETNPRTAGDSAEWFDFFRSYGNGTELKKEVHFDLSNYKGRKMNFLGYDEEITNDFRASDLVQQCTDSNIHIENKVGVWGNNLRPRIRQELYADALRLDNDPTSKQEYRIYVNAANGKCLFDDSEQALYLKKMLERYPDRCTVKFNDIKLSPNDIETIISKKERGVLAKDICQKVLVKPAKESSKFQKSLLGQSSSRTGKLFGGIGAAGAASASSINWGKIITRIISILVVLALLVGAVVLLAKVLPPVFEAIGNFFSAIWKGICKFFSAIGRFFVNLWNGIFGRPKLEFDTLDGGKTYYVVDCRRYWFGYGKDHCIKIPETYKNSPVVGIGESAFVDTGLHELHIPHSIEWIGVDAFKNCNLKKLYIEDIEAWVKIDFRRAENESDGVCYSHPCNYIDNRTLDAENINFIYLNGEEIEELVIPLSVTEISDYAFYNFTGVDKFVIPDSVKKIGHYAFARDDDTRNDYHVTDYKPYGSYWDMFFEGTRAQLRDITVGKTFKEVQAVSCIDGWAIEYDICYNSEPKHTYMFFPGAENESIKEIMDVSSQYVLEKEGYSFLGWTTNTRSYNLEIRIPENGGNINLCAVWEKLYTITLIRDKSQKQIEYNKYVYEADDFSDWNVASDLIVSDVITLPVLSDSEEYIFAGWFASSEYDCEPTIFIDHHTIKVQYSTYYYAGFQRASKGLSMDLPSYPLNWSTNSSNVAVVQGYYGEDTDVVVPLYYQGYKIAAVQEGAFCGTSVKSISLSSNIEFIDNLAFGQSSVEKIVIPSEEIVLEAYAFDSCYNLSTIVFYGTTHIKYRGSKQDWQSNAEKYSFTKSCTIVCSDGIITVE